MTPASEVDPIFIDTSTHDPQGTGFCDVQVDTASSLVNILLQKGQAETLRQSFHALRVQA